MAEGHHIQACPPVLAGYRGEQKTGNHQCPHLCGEFQLSPAPPADAFRLANESLSHIVQVLYNLLFLSLGLWEVRPHLNPSKGETVSYSTLGPLDIRPVGFLSQMFWVQIPGIGVSGVGHQPLASLGQALDG